MTEVITTDGKETTKTGESIKIEIKRKDNNGTKLKYTFRSDVLFKMLFRKYQHLLKRLIAVLLEIPLESITEFYITNTEMPLLEVKRHTPLTDKCGLHFYELPKMQDVESIDPSSEKDLWLALFDAETEQELEHLAKAGGAVMNEAIRAYRGVTATEEFKNLEWLRAKTRNDEANALNVARKQAVKQRDKHWQGVVAEKDATLAEKDAENAELRLQLAKLQVQLNSDKQE